MLKPCSKGEQRHGQKKGEGFMSVFNRRVFITLLLLLGSGLTSEALADAASIRFNLYKAGFIVGASGGKGTITYHGRHYPVSIGGVSLEGVMHPLS